MAKKNTAELREELRGELRSLEDAIKRRKYGYSKKTKDGWTLSASDGSSSFEKAVEELQNIMRGKSVEPDREGVPRPSWEEEKSRVENRWLHEEMEKLKRENTALKGKNTKLSNKNKKLEKKVEALKKRIEELNSYGREDILDLEE